MTAKVSIRRATADDLAGVLYLYAQPEIDNGAVLTIAEARNILARFDRYPDYTLYVADDALGRIVGSYALLVMDSLGHMGAPSAIVEDVVVAPDMQGRGIGTSMMRHAADMAALKQCYKIVLSSNQKRARAHAFYESLGFERHGLSFRLDVDRDRRAV